MVFEHSKHNKYTIVVVIIMKMMIISAKENKYNDND